MGSTEEGEKEERRRRKRGRRSRRKRRRRRKGGGGGGRGELLDQEKQSVHINNLKVKCYAHIGAS